MVNYLLKLIDEEKFGRRDRVSPNLETQEELGKSLEEIRKGGLEDVIEN